MPSAILFCTPIRQLREIEMDSSCANWLYIASIISELISPVSIFSFSKYTDMPSVFSSRTASRLSLVFRANLDIDFVSIRSIFPLRQSLISLWNSVRFAADVPVIP